MKSIIPEIYLENCKEALEYYKNTFGGEIKNIQMADGNPMFKGFEGKVIHSELHINSNCVLYLMDIMNDEDKASKSDLLLEMDSEDEINRIYSVLKEKGTVHFELQKTFWGALHAVITDCYGNTWGLNYTLKN